MSISDQQLGSFLINQLLLLVGYAGMDESLHLLSFDVQTRNVAGDGKTTVPVILVLQSGRPNVLHAVREAVNVTYDWGWNESLLTDGHKLGQFLRRRVSDVVGSSYARIGDLPNDSEAMDVTVIVVPPAHRETVLRLVFELFERDELGRWQ